jgi:hypothetical protein
MLKHHQCLINGVQFGMGGAWAAELLQQMLSCAVTAGLMKALPGGSVDPAAAAAAAAAGAARATSDSSSNSDGAALDSWAEVMSSSISSIAASLFRQTAPLWGSKAVTFTEQYRIFAAHPAVAEVALQHLASRCVAMHKMQVQHQGLQQQQQQLLQQLGKCMRGDLLLLSDPQPRLAALLPGAAMQTAALAKEAELREHGE